MNSFGLTLEVLQDLFDVTRYYDIDRLFEFVCALVRSAGLQGAGWDPYYESEAVLEDLRNLSGLDLPMDKFSDPDRTRMRLALLSYCHLIEMDLPYDANLLRLKSCRVIGRRSANHVLKAKP